MIVPPPAELRALLARHLRPPLRRALQQAVTLAEAQNVACYLVGGPVRDLLLRKPIDDLDLVFEGDAIALAQQFANANGGAMTRHAAFGTASVELHHAQERAVVDFVTARSERYPRPAALPVVEPASISDDLRRRDFTINTLALRLRSEQPLEMLDLVDGAHDLQQGLIRVLHERSFVDDPTRIVRAARFAARLHFDLDPATEMLAFDAAASGMIERTSPQRILHELWLTFREPAPADVLRILQRLGSVEHVIPGLRLSDGLADEIARARASAMPDEDRRLLLLALIGRALGDEGHQRLEQRYSFSGAEQRVLGESGAVDELLAALAQPGIRPSQIDRLLQGRSRITLALAALVAPEPARQIIADYLATIQHVPTLLNGDDLRALGIPPGPRYRELLANLRAAQLDGRVTTRAAAQDWVLRQT